MACGTGGWAGPLPGDPSDASGLTATPAFGGIELAWQYPGVNPQAVAYWILFKSTLPEFATAIKYRVRTGNYYFDRIDVEQGLGPYSYWIQGMSVNGTPGAVLGPATATARPTIEQTIRDLTGMIDAGFLAQSLRTEIERIEALNTDLAQEILDRLSSNEAFANLLQALQSDVDGAMTLIQNLQTQQNTDNLAQVSSLNLLAAALNDNIAALANEQTVRATADSAMASSISTLVTQVGDNTAAIATETTARTSADSALATQITELQAETGDLSAAIATETAARASADSALASQVATIQATLNGLGEGDLSEAQALVEVEAAARVAGDAALANQITTAQTTLNGQIASVQTGLQSQITTANGKITDIGALWTAKVQVNGLIGGFGVYNNGNEVQAGFDVDTFWIGRTGSDLKKPFIVSGGEVFINKAVIQQLTADDIDTRGLVVRAADGTPILASGNAIAITDVRHRGSLNLSPVNLWQVGYTATPGVSMVGVANAWMTIGHPIGSPQQSIIYSTGPYGSMVPVWRAVSGSGGNAQGGYTSMGPSNPVNRNKAYRVAQWIRVSGDLSGQIYLGTAGGVLNLPDQTANTNPYMVVANRNTLVPGRWYLMVGYIHQNGHTTQSALSGIYDGVTGKKILTGTDFAWGPASSEGGWRSFQFYTSAAGAITDFAQPLVNVLDGGELSIQQLLSYTAVSGFNPINASNISTYMETAAITTAYIGNLAVKNAQIDNLTIGTEKYQPNSVTTVVSGSVAKVARTVISNVSSRVTSTTIGSIQTSPNGDGRVLLWVTPAGWPDLQQWETFSFVLAEASLTPPAGSGTCTITFRVRRNGVSIWQQQLVGFTAGGGTLTRFCSAIMVPDTPGPGVTATYVLEVESTSFSPTNHASNIVPFTYALMETKK